MTASPTLTERPAWKALATHYSQIRGVHLRQLFADDPKRGERLTAEILCFSIPGRRCPRLRVALREFCAALHGWLRSLLIVWSTTFL